MAIDINHTPLFTVKYVDTDGAQKFLDLQATGMTDAQNQFKKSHPNCQVVNVWRKS